MIDLTPLDVRNKRGDFDKNLRGYDPQEVDTFLELVAERLEELVMENLQLRERTEGLQKQVDSQSGREKAVQEALVTAQELRSEMKNQAQREAELILGEARTEARRLVAEAEAEVRTLLRDAEGRLEDGRQALEELERRRMRFLKAFRQLLERELDVCEVEEDREPLEIKAIDLDLGGGRRAAPRDESPATSALGGERDPAEVVEPGTRPAEGGEAGGNDRPNAPVGSDELVSAATEEVRDILAGLDPHEEGDAVEWVEEAGPDAERTDETLSFFSEEEGPVEGDGSQHPGDADDPSGGQGRG